MIVSPLPPIVMTLLLGVITIGCYFIAKYRNWLDNPILIIIMLFLIAFTNISFTANIGPYFYQLMGYNVTDQSTITSSDAANSLLTSVLTVVIGYVFLKYGNPPG